MVLAILGGMIALLLPAVQDARNSARVAVCKNRIRQIDQAARACAALKRPAERLSDWPVLILPWIEEQPLADRLDSTPGERWPDTPRPTLYRCPLREADAANQRHYAWIVYGSVNDFGGGWPFPTFRDTGAIDPSSPRRWWFDGAVVGIDEANRLVETTRGPHPGDAWHEARNGGEVRVLVANAPTR